VLAGYAAGVSRPNVNPMFPGRVTNDVRGVFGGAGIHVPLRPQLGLFADARLMLGEEANELLALAPVRVGVSWRF
jgi:predicted methyltransferase MtxX (methanogen marker protein 4)